MINSKFLFLLFTIYYLLFTVPVYATHNPSCTDPDNLECKVCKDEYGDHHVDTTWDGACSITSGKRVVFACDHTGRITRVGEINDPACGQAAPVGPTGPIDIKKVFGEIKPPQELLPFIREGGQGAGGISLFFSNLVVLIYIVASIVFVFMLLWGAFEWLTSGGDKEKVDAARRRLTNAFIGIILFAIAFAVLRVIGIFTGFTFFGPPVNRACPQREEYYLEDDKCIHKFFTGPKCEAIFREVGRSRCP